jgi:hypothetical protein
MGVLCHQNSTNKYVLQDFGFGSRSSPETVRYFKLLFWSPWIGDKTVWNVGTFDQALFDNMRMWMGTGNWKRRGNDYGFSWNGHSHLTLQYRAGFSHATGCPELVMFRRRRLH